MSASAPRPPPPLPSAESCENGGERERKKKKIIIITVKQLTIILYRSRRVQSPVRGGGDPAGLPSLADDAVPRRRSPGNLATLPSKHGGGPQKTRNLLMRGPRRSPRARWRYNYGPAQVVYPPPPLLTWSAQEGEGASGVAPWAH